MLKWACLPQVCNRHGSQQCKNGLFATGLQQTWQPAMHCCDCVLQGIEHAAGCVQTSKFVYKLYVNIASEMHLNALRILTQPSLTAYYI